MSTRRETYLNRCTSCRIKKDLCICERIQRFKNSTSISIIMHYKELALTSNTALLAQKSLTSCDLYLRGHPQKEFQEKIKLPQDKKSYVLFPGADSIPIQEIENKDIHLIIPDGSWRQAKKIQRREPYLRELPMVRLTNREKSNYHLRTQKDELGFCTLEAIAFALGILEDKKLQNGLLSNLDIMVSQILKTRGNAKSRSPICDATFLCKN